MLILELQKNQPKGKVQEGADKKKSTFVRLMTSLDRARQVIELVDKVRVDQEKADQSGGASQAAQAGQKRKRVE